MVCRKQRLRAIPISIFAASLSRAQWPQCAALCALGLSHSLSRSDNYAHPQFQLVPTKNVWKRRSTCVCCEYELKHVHKCSVNTWNKQIYDYKMPNQHLKSQKNVWISNMNVEANVYKMQIIPMLIEFEFAPIHTPTFNSNAEKTCKWKSNAKNVWTLQFQ